MQCALVEQADVIVAFMPFIPNDVARLLIQKALSESDCFVLHINKSGSNQLLALFLFKVCTSK
jgi:hypothetical protein